MHVAFWMQALTAPSSFYANYVQFWWREISQHGVKAVMDKYVFSDQSGAMFIR